MADVERIPLFPLNTVLFPGMWLPLQVFEERYKQMLRDCGMVEGSFGVALIREGQEVGSTAFPHDVGTVARIAKAVPLQDDRVFIQTQGLRRFRVHRLIHDRPYLQGDVEFLPEPRVDRRRTNHVLKRVVERYQTYIEAVRALGRQIMDAPHISHDPEVFSWLVASTLLVPTTLLQRLLETDDVRERLEQEADLLDESTRMLRGRLERKSGARPGNSPFSLN
jgi:Lon protease-like protein